MADSAASMSAFRRAGGDLRRRHHVDRHVVAGPATPDERAAQGAAKGGDAGFIQVIHPGRVEIVCRRPRAQYHGITKLVDIYATLNRMRVLSSPKVIAEADNALRMIIDTYARENTTFSGVRQSISHGFLDPLRAFSERAMKS
jgi:hypothetical protein